MTRFTQRSVLAGLAGLLALAAGSLLGGCSEKSSKPMPENSPPVTFLSIQATLPDTVDYRVALHWWGSDPDGQVSGYLIRWNGAWTPPAGSHPYSWAGDSTWVFTTATTDTFATQTGPVPENDRIASAADTFRVRAVDDRGLVDPVGRTQIFQVRNWAPTLEWARSLPRPVTSLPAVSFAWHPTDLDGHETVRTFRYWLDGADSSAAGAHVIGDTVATLIPRDFDEHWGVRTLSVQAVDESQTPSNIIRHRWTVEAPPSEHCLLIDNVGARVPRADSTDLFFRSIMQSVAPGDTYVLDMEGRGGFRTEWEVFPMLALFLPRGDGQASGVVWYSGPASTNNDEFFKTNLTMAQRGIEQYLDAGGHLLVVAHNALSDSIAHASGGFSFAFERRRLGLTGLYRLDRNNIIGSDIGLFVNTWVQTDAGGSPESLVVRVTSRNTDFVVDAPGAVPLLWTRPGVLGSAVAERYSGAVLAPAESGPAYLGILRDTGASRMAVLSFLLEATGPLEGRNRIASALFRRILD